MLASGDTITAVIDWEIWTVGDPRVDLGWFLVNADPDTYRRPTRYAGALPSPSELAALYGDVPDLAWFKALACFKSTATWALIVKHNRRRPDPDPGVELVAADLPRLLDRARAGARRLSPAGRPASVQPLGIPLSLSATFASAASLSRRRCSEGKRSGAGL
jgi:hypothetical protein